MWQSCCGEEEFLFNRYDCNEQSSILDWTVASWLNQYDVRVLKYENHSVTFVQLSWCSWHVQIQLMVFFFAGNEFDDKAAVFFAEALEVIILII